MNLSNKIAEIFENLLEKKGIEIPCSDKVEEAERHQDGNSAKLYGMEYFNLVDEISGLLNGYPCIINGSETSKLSIPFEADNPSVYVEK
mgnify:CR=1 FL=1